MALDRVPRGHVFVLRRVNPLVERFVHVSRVPLFATEVASVKFRAHGLPRVKTIAAVDGRTHTFEGGLLVQRMMISLLPHLFALVNARTDPDGATHIARDATVAPTDA